MHALIHEAAVEWGHSEVLKGWKVFEGLERHRLRQNRLLGKHSPHLLELYERTQTLGAYVEA